MTAAGRRDAVLSAMTEINGTDASNAPAIELRFEISATSTTSATVTAVFGRATRAHFLTRRLSPPP
jgi:hypothetical protein